MRVKARAVAKLWSRVRLRCKSSIDRMPRQIKPYLTTWRALEQRLGCEWVGKVMGRESEK